MSFWAAAVAIVAILAFTNMRRHRDAMRWQGDAAAPPSDLEREVVELRRRVETLERIITDGRGGADLAREIEALRDR
ncbi:MAG: hypothetical protein RIS94_1930 [Pseudomonadota bacterium]|jgi:hypothetical protein